MSETPSGSASGSATPKGIGSLAKKQSDLTRQGTQRLKFTPTLPVRRKKDESKPEPAATTISEPPNTNARGRARGRGSTDTGRGRGRGRGTAPPVEMTATGPFALGPTVAGTQARRSTSRALAASTSATGSITLGENLTRTSAPALRGLHNGKAKIKEEEELYSDPDEGVEIIDIKKIKDMDWMAPESLEVEKKLKKLRGAGGPDIIDLKNALDLSESEDEEEREDLIEYFVTNNGPEDDPTFREDRLYFFQFPTPFPRFTKQSLGSSPFESPNPRPEQLSAESSTKKVSFAPDTKPAVTPGISHPSTTTPEPAKEDPVDGVVGRLEVYKSGAVKIRLVNGTLLDVRAASQPSFFQQAVHLDMNNKRLAVLGEVNKQFVVSPDIDYLLEAMERKEHRRC